MTQQSSALVDNLLEWWPIKKRKKKWAEIQHSSCYITCVDSEKWALLVPFLTLNYNFMSRVTSILSPLHSFAKCDNLDFDHCLSNETVFIKVTLPICPKDIFTHDHSLPRDSASLALLTPFHSCLFSVLLASVILTVSSLFFPSFSPFFPGEVPSILVFLRI